LPEEAPVKSCYEAGRDGFWLQCHLVAQGIENVVVIRPVSRSTAGPSGPTPIVLTWASY
jgi:hypothetical protein